MKNSLSHEISFDGMMSVIFRIFKLELPSTRLQLSISQVISINSRLEDSLILRLLFRGYEETIFASPVVCLVHVNIPC